MLLIWPISVMNQYSQGAATTEINIGNLRMIKIELTLQIESLCSDLYSFTNLRATVLCHSHLSRQRGRLLILIENNQ